MIDYFHISVICKALPRIGKALRVEHANVTSETLTPHIVRLARGGPQLEVRVKVKTRRIHFLGSPAQWLQGHNGVGSNNLQGLVQESVLLLFATLQLPVPPEIRKRIARGDYKVHEVHIAELHRMPHDLIAPLCDHIRRTAISEVSAVPLSEGNSKGLGVRLWPLSRSRSVLLYDKNRYFNDGRAKRLSSFLGAEAGPGREVAGAAYLRLVDDYLKLGVRIEVRLKRMLTAAALRRGREWSISRARAVYLQVLRELPLGDLPGLAHIEKMRTVMPPRERQLFEAWYRGANMRSLFDSSRSFGKWRARLREHGVDIARAPICGDQVSWSSLISEESIVKLPRWAAAAGLLFVPRRSEYGRPRLERVWLRHRREKGARSSGQA